MPDGTISKEPLVGCTIFNRRSRKGIVSNVNGEFSISAAVGDTLEVRYVGYKTKKTVVTEDMKNTSITLVTDPSALSGLVEVVAGMIPAAGRKDFHFIDLNVIDENGNPIYRSVFSTSGGQYNPGVYESYWSSSGPISEERIG